MAASAPASEAVWREVACRACSERPTFIATIGFLSSPRLRAADVEAGDASKRLDVQADAR